MPSAVEPPPSSSTPATYSVMLKGQGGRKQPAHTDAPRSASFSHGSGNKSTTTTSSETGHYPQPQQQQEHQQGQNQRDRGGRSRGNNTSTYYHTPRRSQQHQHQHQNQNQPAHHGRKTGQPNNNNHRKEAAAHHQEEEEDVYVLTLLTDPSHERAMSALRRQWFPAHRLKVDAHMTLFHALPGHLLETMKRDLADAAANTQEFKVEVDLRQDVWRMGRKGVAVSVRGAQLDLEGVVGGMRRGLIDRWKEMGEDENTTTAAAASADGSEKNIVVAHGREKEEKTHGVLSAQDSRRGWKAHYTIMNKEEDPARVEECFHELRGGSSGLRPARSEGAVMGLRLWRYDRGWWRQEEDFLFSGGKGSGK
ncbi:hypothetical protein PG984_015173 [Apiospora sp. TS-2023a]